MIKLFTEHSKSVGESYQLHGPKAVGFSVQILYTTFCCLIYKVFPLVLQTTANNIARKVCNDVDRQVENNNFHQLLS